MLEVEVLLDVVGSELNTGLLVGDRALRADTHGVPSISNDLVNISGIILTGVVGLKDSGSHLVLNQALGTFRLRHLSGGVIEDHINDIHSIAVYHRHRHRGRVRAAFRRVANGDDGIRVTVFRQLKEVVQLVLVEQQTLRFKRLLLELTLKLLCAQKFPLLPEVGGGKDLLALPFILIIALVRHKIEGGYLNRSPSPTLPLCVFLHTTDGVIQGIASAGENHRRTFNGTTHNIAGDHFPLIIKPLAVFGFLTTFHTVIKVEDIGGFGQAHLSSVNGTTHDGGETGLAFQIYRF